MATLSKYTAEVTLPNGVKLNPISVRITADETWSPYIQGTVVLPSDQITGTIDPRTGSRLGIRLQQDFSNLIYISDITADYGGNVAAITAGISPSLVSAFTDKYTAPWNIFGTTPTTPYTVFLADLGIRSISYDYVSKEATLDLASDEAIAQDKYGFGESTPQPYYSIRTVINKALSYIGASLEPGTADVNTPLGYYIEAYNTNASMTPWAFIETAADSVNFRVYCDEQRRWYLVEQGTTTGTLVLDDNDNITSFQKNVTREDLWYNQALIEYEDNTGALTVDAYTGTVVGPIKTYYEKRNVYTAPGNGAAQGIVTRSQTRAETYNIEATASLEARPKQVITIDITGETLKSGVIQSITWSLPSARMSVDIRDLQEV